MELTIRGIADTNKVCTEAKTTLTLSNNSSISYPSKYDLILQQSGPHSEVAEKVKSAFNKFAKKTITSEKLQTKIQKIFEKHEKKLIQEPVKDSGKLNLDHFALKYLERVNLSADDLFGKSFQAANWLRVFYSIKNEIDVKDARELLKHFPVLVKNFEADFLDVFKAELKSDKPYTRKLMWEYFPGIRFEGFKAAIKKDDKWLCMSLLDIAPLDDKFKGDLLFYAAGIRPETVQELLGWGFRSALGKAVELAILLNNFRSFEHLISMGLTDDERGDAVKCAVMNGQLPYVESLLKNGPISCKAWCDAILRLNPKDKSAPIAEILFKYAPRFPDSDESKKDAVGRAICAAIMKCQLNLAKALIQGGPVDDNTKRDAFYLAARKFPEIFEFLFGLGFEKSDLVEAIKFAIKQNEPDLAKILIRKSRINEDERDELTEMALSCKCYKTIEEIVQMGSISVPVWCKAIKALNKGSLAKTLEILLENMPTQQSRTFVEKMKDAIYTAFSRAEENEDSKLIDALKPYVPFDSRHHFKSFKK